MSGNYLLDTNIVIAVFASEQPVLVSRDNHFTQVEGLIVEGW
jgi:predicted nucleic acid-binding protein